VTSHLAQKTAYVFLGAPYAIYMTYMTRILRVFVERIHATHVAFAADNGLPRNLLLRGRYLVLYFANLKQESTIIIGECYIMRVVLSLLLVCFVFTQSVVYANEPVQVAGPMFKGVELYSWRGANTDDWQFVLLPGTNRLKTTQEILAYDQVLRSVEELKDRLAQLAPSEQVFWSVPDAKIFSLPTREVIDDLIDYAETVNVDIQVLTE
jgi:hypothetical protein